MDRSVNADPGQRADGHDRWTQWRSWIGFWILGLCNNFAYVVMLSAAHDILRKQESGNSTATVTLAMDLQVRNNSNTSRFDCNPVSTAAVLLADILPSLTVKLVAPLVIHAVPYGIRVMICVAMTATSFLLVAFSTAVWMSILGVIFASFSSGLGELSFLALSAFFSRDVLGGWGSGTGGAGVAGAFLYSAMTQIGLSPQITLLTMLVIPFFMVVSYFFLLVFPTAFPQWKSSVNKCLVSCSEERERLIEEADERGEEEREKARPEDGTTGTLSFAEKRRIIRGLLKFMIPLGLVYFAEYFINQGLMELLYFPNFFLSHSEQYRWYQTLYQVGVFVSRSSLCCFKIRKLWILAVLQILNAVLLLLAVGYQLLPSAWLVFVIILYEGLLGGAAYVNTFFFISVEAEDSHREFSMATASVGDSVGIALAASVAFPVHRHFCSQ